MADEKKNINYINKDFNQFKTSLVDYAKTYFPTVYNDFTPSSPGMMFMEMSAYRQALRDITEGLSTVEQVNSIVFPTKP